MKTSQNLYSEEFQFFLENLIIIIIIISIDFVIIYY